MKKPDSHRIAIAVVFAFLCVGCCGYALQDCPGGIHVTIQAASGNSFPKDASYLLKWYIGQTTGTVSSEDPSWSGYKPEALTFDISYFTTTSDQVEIELFNNDNLVGERQTFALDWETTVCNEASGPSWCDDDMTSDAYVTTLLDESF